MLLSIEVGSNPSADVAADVTASRLTFPKILRKQTVVIRLQNHKSVYYGVDVHRQTNRPLNKFIALPLNKFIALL